MSATRILLPFSSLFLAASLCAQQPADTAPTQASTQTGSQESEPPMQTLRVSTKIVLVDVSVTDSDGNPISGLKAGDFSLLENGKPQHIRSFDEHLFDASKPAPANPKLPKLGPDVFTNYTPAPASGTLTVVLLDMLNTPFRQQSIVRSQLLKFLNGMPSGQRVAIFGLSNKLLLLQGFTSDPEILKTALKASSKGQLSRLLGDPAGGTDANAVQYGNDPDTAAVFANLTQLEAQMATVQQQIRTQYTLDGLELLARYLSGMSGRKNVLWFSSNFPTSIVLDDSGNGNISQAPDLAAQIRETTNLLAATQTAIFPIDAEGLFADPGFSATASRSAKGAQQSLNMSNNFQKTATGHASMDALAADTGGHAFYNTNGLKEAAVTAIAIGSNYYTLAYTPADRTSDGSFRRISIKVAGKQYRLSYRSGYYADKPADALATTNPATTNTTDPDVPKPGSVSAALMRGAPNPTEILFKVRAQPVSGDEAAPAEGNDLNPKLKGPYRRYVIDFGADIHNVTAQLLPDGLHHVSLEFVTIVYDEDGAMINSVSNAVTGDMTNANYQGALRSGMKLRQQVSIPAKGEFFFRVAVHDTLSNRLGTVEIPVSQLKMIPEDIAPAPAAPTVTPTKKP